MEARVSDSFLAIGPSKPETYVMYCYYQFLKLDGLHKLEPREAQQLELTGSLHVPSGPVANEFVRQYFLHVHPCVPLLDEGIFWCLFLGRESYPGKDRAICLFVFQAMLFVASGVSLLSSETDQKKNDR
jgi:hypothetical protein